MNAFKTLDPPAVDWAVRQTVSKSSVSTSFRIRKVLFPIDFSEACVSAAAYAAAFAGRFQAELTLLHVVDFGEDVSSGVASLQGTKWTHENGSRYIAEDLKHLDVKRQLLRGDPAHHIVQTAKESDTDLIMMPSHGLSSFRRYILGSITAKVLHDAEGPVWTSVHLENLPVLEDIRFRKVLCAIDLGPQSADALRWAAGFAKEHSAELLAVHVVPAWEAHRYKFVNEPIVNVLEHQARRQLHELLESSRIEARVMVASGEPSKVVSEIAQAENVDQMVIARGSAADGFGRLRGNAYAIIRSAPCPVVSV